MITEELQHKIVCAIELIQLAAPKDGSPIEVAYSGGKDSDVILQLTKEAGVAYRAIYKNTTIDPPGTVKHAKDMGAEVVRPKKTFFQLMQEKGMPSRYVRFCCSELKEYKILDKCIVGVRKAESRKRAQLYKEPTMCRAYNKNEKAELIIPLLDWTDDDVLAFVVDRGIKLHPLYYDKGGQINVKKRLGCMVCPLVSLNKKIEVLRQYPRLVRLMAKALQIYRNDHPTHKCHKTFKDEYAMLAFSIFGIDSKTTSCMCIDRDFKTEIEEFFKIKF